jgi:hypothetical protein
VIPNADFVTPEQYIMKNKSQILFYLFFSQRDIRALASRNRLAALSLGVSRFFPPAFIAPSIEAGLILFLQNGHRGIVIPYLLAPMTTFIAALIAGP